MLSGFWLKSAPEMCGVVMDPPVNIRHIL
jgi:hypothetical protein